MASSVLVDLSLPSTCLLPPLPSQSNPHHAGKYWFQLKFSMKDFFNFSNISRSVAKNFSLNFLVLFLVSTFELSCFVLGFNIWTFLFCSWWQHLIFIVLCWYHFEAMKEFLVSLRFMETYFCLSPILLRCSQTIDCKEDWWWFMQTSPVFYNSNTKRIILIYFFSSLLFLFVQLIRQIRNWYCIRFYSFFKCIS